MDPLLETDIAVAADVVAGLRQNAENNTPTRCNAATDSPQIVFCTMPYFGNQLGASIVKSTLLVCATILLKHVTSPRKNVVKRIKDDYWMR